MGFIPPLNPLGVQGVAQMELHNWREGVNYGSRFAPGDLYYRDPDGTAHVVTPKETASRDGRLVLDRDPETPIQTSTLAWWQVRLAQFFWLNWFLFCFNVFLPGFPLDGGRLLQSIVWARSDYRQGTLAAIYGGYGVAGLLFVFALAYNETLALFIALFVGLTSYQEYFKLQHAMEDSPFGYDFSAGYTSLERDEERPRPRRQNFFQRWLQQRAARRLQKEIEQREYEDRRMDELLDKVHRLGKESLTTEERRFMERVSNRFRNR
jgi:membrane-associated protease RseP (regulator of RpoE activity)